MLEETVKLTGLDKIRRLWWGSAVRAIGPRAIGGVYHSHYWNQDYRVDGVWVGEYPADVPTDYRQHQAKGHWSITVTWLPGTCAVTHSTRWQYDRDTVVSQPHGAGLAGRQQNAP